MLVFSLLRALVKRYRLRFSPQNSLQNTQTVQRQKGCCEFHALLWTVKEAAAVSPVAQLLGQVDVQDVRQDGGELRDIAQSGADGVGGVDVVQLFKHSHGY